MLSLKRHDTRTAINATLKSPDGQPVDLSGATVMFTMAKYGNIFVNRFAEIIDPRNGKVQFRFRREETSELGIMKAEFEVTYPDGTVETFPNSGYIEIKIEADLGGSSAEPPPNDTTAPSNPTDLAATNVTATSVDLSWTAATDNVGVTGYEVYRGDTLLATVSGTTYLATGLTQGTTYTFTVKAKDAAGNASNGVTVDATTTASSDSEAPSAVTNLSASGTTQTTTDLSWTAATDNVSVTGYNVYKDGVLLTTVTGTTYKATGLTASTTYSFSVRAKDAAGNLSTAAIVSVTTTEAPPAEDTTPPNAVTGLEPSNVTTGSLTLIWTASTSNDVAAYEVYNGSVLLGETEETTFFVTGLDVNTTYTLGVQARDFAGNKSNLVTVEVQTLDADTVIETNLQFNGTSDYLRTPVIQYTKMVMDIYVDPVTASSYLTSSRGIGSGINHIYYSLNLDGTDFTGLSSVQKLIDGQGPTLDAVPRQTRLTLTLQYSDATVTTYNPTFFARDSATIGSFLKGKLYDLKIYNGTELVVHYDTRTGTVEDQSGNGNHGILTGGSFVDEEVFVKIQAWVGGVENYE